LSIKGCVRSGNLGQTKRIDCHREIDDERKGTNTKKKVVIWSHNFKSQRKAQIWTALVIL